MNVSPDLQVNSYMQYDNTSASFGANTWLRWSRSPLGELFVIHSYSLRHNSDPSRGLPLPGRVLTYPARRLDPR